MTRHLPNRKGIFILVFKWSTDDNQATIMTTATFKCVPVCQYYSCSRMYDTKKGILKTSGRLINIKAGHTLRFSKNVHIIQLPKLREWIIKVELTSLMCLYVFIKSTLSFRSGAKDGSRKCEGILACIALMSVDDVGLIDLCNNQNIFRIPVLSITKMN